MRLPGLVVLIAIAPFAACGHGDRGAVDAGRLDAGTADAGTADAVPAPDATPALGVPDGTYLDELTADQAHDLCTWMVDVQGGPHTIDCGGGTKITIDPVADCLQNLWPHCQVGLLRPCIEAQAKDECGPAPAACTAFYQCAGG
jgi:hypothetical protein